MSKSLYLERLEYKAHQGVGELNARLQTSAEKSTTINIANSLWKDKSHEFLNTFLQKINEYYDSSVNEVDFYLMYEQARLKINGWVAEKTNQKIKDLFKPGDISPETVLVLANAIYFKSNWKYAFDKEFTQPKDFHVSKDKIVQVPMMVSYDYSYKVIGDEHLTMIELPYDGDHYSMVVVLPVERFGLASLEENLSNESLQKYLRELDDTWPFEIGIQMPRFELEEELDLKSTLQSLGIIDAFEAGRADLSKMNGTKGLSVSKVRHKAFVKVSEEGTEAAAATGVGIVETTSVSIPKVIIADQPFLFLIRHQQTGAILFMGRLTNPQ